MKIKMIIFLFLCLSFQMASAISETSLSGVLQRQDKKTITGLVVDEKGESIIGASIISVNSKTGTVTDLNGSFSVNLPINDVMIEISYIGYITQTMNVSNQIHFKIVLLEDTKNLDEVVVVGYGTQKKAELTSSITSVKSEAFVKGFVQDAGQLIKGKVPGLGIITRDGDPIGSSQVVLRGVGTLKSGSSPLVIIDGVPGELNSIAPEDIESIDVVKDGSAAAIYGTRGNNGVIFITTRKVNRDMPPTIEFTSYLTTQQITKKLDFMNADEYRKLVQQNKPGAYDYGHNTDWLDEILRTPVSYVVNASLKGGTSKTNYIANVNYKSTQGIMKKSDADVLTTRLEVNHSMWDRLVDVNFNMMGRQVSYDALGDGLGDDHSARGEIYRNAIGYIPTEQTKDGEGKWVEHTAMHEVMNPLALIYEVSGQNKIAQLKTFGSIKITPIEQLYFKILLSNTTENETRGYAETKKHYSTVKNGKNGFASRGTGRIVDNLMELTANYNQKFGKHGITGLLGYSYQDYGYEFYWMQNWDFPSDYYSYNNMGSGAALKRGEAPESSTKNSSKLIGFFGRVNYNYDNRYLLSISLRHEGSSKFGKDHKWGNFPAASVGWNIANEDFLKELESIDNLKLRVGFGITGTIPNDPYKSLSTIKTGDNFLTGSGQWTTTLQPESNANPDLRWEKKEEWNLGIDYGVLDNRIYGSLDFYQRKTKDMLWDYVVPMPPYLFSKILANAGTMENKGLELSLSTVPVRTREVEWTSTINYSTNKNKLISLSNDKFQVQSGFIDAGGTGEPIQQQTHRLFKGGEVGNFFGFKTIDIDPDGYWIIEGADGKPKSIKDQVPEDKKIIGNGFPKHFLSWNNSIYYKQFDLNIMMRGAFGYDILNYPRMFYEVPINLTRGNLLRDAYTPKYGKTVLNDQQQLQYVSYFIENGNYWKIDNITLGYTFKNKNKVFQQMRVYVSGNNLITFTKYSGLDPEVNTQGLDPGCDPRDRYPSTRSYTMGLMVTF